MSLFQRYTTSHMFVFLLYETTFCISISLLVIRNTFQTKALMNVSIILTNTVKELSSKIGFPHVPYLFRITI